jgi:prevent-host-death family protein
MPATPHRQATAVVTKHGEEVAVAVSIEDYRRLTEEPPSFKEFLS